MIVCDLAYLRELERRMKAARRELPRDVAAGMDAEIEAIEAEGDPWYSIAAIEIGFRLKRHCLKSRISNNRPNYGFQGHLRKLGKYIYATWFDAMTVNKDTQVYRTWRNPDDAIHALQIAHRIARYENPNPHTSQAKLDKWRLENGDEKVL